jgi:hypothetical protein
MGEDNLHYDCFVSYSWKDREYVDQVVEDLKNIGFNVWIDRDRIKPGQRIREAIHRQIDNAFCVLVFLSTRSLSSSFVLNEIDIAMLQEMNKKKVILIPILLGRLRIDDVPADLRGKLSVDLRGNLAKRYKLARSALIHAIQAANPDKFGEGFLFKEFVVDKEIFSHFAQTVNDNRRINTNVLYTVSEIIAETIIESKEQILEKENVDKLDDILGFFGKKGLRDLIAFCIIYRELLLTGEVSEDDFRAIIAFLKVFLPVFGINQKIFKAFDKEKLPIVITMGISPNDGLAYRMTGIEGYENILRSIASTGEK